METVHIVHPRRPSGPHAKLPMQFSDPDEASTRAAAIAGKYVGGIAYTMDVDEAAGEYSEPRVLLQIGDVPDLFG